MRRKDKNTPTSTIYPPWTSDLEPAPGDLRIIQAFVNSRHVAKKTDQLASPEALGRWLTGWGLVPEGTQLGERQLQRAVKVRWGLRVLVAANMGVDVKPEALDALEEAASTSKLAVRFTADGEPRLRPAESGIDAAIGRLVLALVMARHEGKWERMKICREPECGRIYYDFSPGRTSKWCAYRCGNRRSAKRARKRNKRWSFASDPWLDGWEP